MRRDDPGARGAEQLPGLQITRWARLSLVVAVSVEGLVDPDTRIAHVNADGLGLTPAVLVEACEQSVNKWAPEQEGTGGS